MHPLSDISESVPAPVSMPEAYSSERAAEQLRRYGVAHVIGLLPEALLAQLHAEIVAKDQSEELTPAAIGRGNLHREAAEIRSDKTEWIEGATLAQTMLLQRLETVRQELNQQLMLGLFDIEAHYAVYRPGDFYARHTDSLHGAKNRLLSLVCYLNPAWQVDQGGALLLYSQNDDAAPTRMILPEFGHAVLFLSEETPHEVAVTHRTRYSIAAWFRCHQPL